MTRSDSSPQERARAADAARQAARHAAQAVAREAGADIITRPIFPGAKTTVQDVEPLAGASAARQIEAGARHAAREYIRGARETGHTWHQIGQALGLVPGGDADPAGQTIAEAACTYAAGTPDTETAWQYGRSFAWTCHSCDKTISDRGLCNGPADDEHGHAENCPRLAATIAAWQAQWEAGQ